MDEDTDNDFMVGVQGGKVVIMMPPRGPIAPGPAIRLAAWIVALTDHSHEHQDFHAALSAIESA